MGDLGSSVFPTRNKTYYVVAIAGYSRTRLTQGSQSDASKKSDLITVILGSSLKLDRLHVARLASRVSLNF